MYREREKRGTYELRTARRRGEEAIEKPRPSYSGASEDSPSIKPAFNLHLLHRLSERRQTPDRWYVQR